MTVSITDFLEARFAEDWEAATASITIVGDTWEASGSVVEVKGETKGRSVFEWTVCFDEGAPTEAQAEHIARHDPAHVLREVESKRAILELGDCLACDVEGQPCDHRNETLRHLAAAYSDHPDFNPEWTTT